MSTDGIFFVIKDTTNEEREMSQKEKEFYHCEDFEKQMFSTVNGKKVKSSGYKEQGIKITVKKHEPQK